MKNISLAAVTVLSAFAAAPAAVAQDRYEVRIVFGDLDLTTQDGADRMLERIEDAARDVCETGRGLFGAHLEERACVSDFTRRALSELNRAAPQRAYARNEPSAAITAASR